MKFGPFYPVPITPQSLSKTRNPDNGGGTEERNVFKIGWTLDPGHQPDYVVDLSSKNPETKNTPKPDFVEKRKKSSKTQKLKNV